MWISSANAAAVAEKNFRIVHGPSDFFYLVSSIYVIYGTNSGLMTLDRIVEAEVGLVLIPRGML